MARIRTVVAAAALTTFLAGALPAQEPGRFRLPMGPESKAPTALEKLSVRTVVSHEMVRPGGSLHVAVEMRIAEGFWIYGPEPGGKIVPAQGLKIQPLRSPLRAGKVLFGPTRPHVTRFADGTSDTHNVYEGTTIAYVPVSVPADLAPGEYELPLRITAQVCDANVCLQLDTTVSARVEVGVATVVSPAWTGAVAEGLSRARPAGGPAAEPARAGRIEYEVFGGAWWTQVGFVGGLAVAFWAGVLLNVMPCVLPVIPLRLLALLNQAGQSRRRFITLGLAFAGGIALFFAGMAVASVALKLALGYNVTLNDLFRHRPLVVGLVLLLVALAAGMFDVFTLTVPGKVAGAEGGRGHLGAVGMGFLMAVLSTPCSGPVLAGAFTWAQLQPLWLGTLSLLVMGAGMASPHAAISFFPRLVSRIPRAGRWTALLKQFVGFVLLGIAVWLLGTQLTDGYLGWVMGYGVVLAACLWVWGKWVGPDSGRGRRWAVRACAVAVAAACGWWMLTPPAPPVVEMRPFDAGEIAAARRAGRPVLVKFTAGWCVECMVVEKKIYEDPEVAAALRARNVLAVEGDVTNDTMPATKMLYEQLGQSGPPVTAIFPPGERAPILLRGGFSKADLFAALAAATGRE